MKSLIRVASVLFVVALAISVVGPVSASDSALELIGAINESSNVGAGQSTNYVFRDITKTFNYSGGPVCLSSRGDQCSPPAIDDAVRIYVDGSEVFYQESYTHDFGPIDFSGKLHVGSNQVRVQLIDLIGPSRGGSALYLVPASGGGSDDKLEITAVNGPIGLLTSAKMGSPYSVEVVIHNPSSSQLTGTVYLEEMGNAGNGDSLSSIKNLTLTLNPGETQRIKFDNYVHKWSWLQGVSNDCSNAGNIILSVALSHLGSLNKVIKELGNVYDFLQFSDDANLSQSRHKFTYRAHVVTNGNSSNDVSSGEVWVDVPWNKIVDFMTYWLGMEIAPGYTAGGIAATAYGQPWGELLIQQEAITLSGSCASFNSATDPDPNYREIATPQPVVVPSIENYQGEYKQASIDGLTYLSIQRALYQTTARYEGARAANDAEWMNIQGRVARKFIVELLYILDAWDNSNTTMLSATRGDNLMLTPDEIAIARAYLAEHGLPSDEVNMLRELGFGETQINAIPNLTSKFIEPDATWPKLFLPGDVLSPEYVEMIAGLNSELVELNEVHLDTIAPLSTIQLNGTIGENDWFISNVLIALTAEDNPGGSGVAQIEWSLDEGRTWNLYTGQIVHTQEGVFHLIVRATDSEGNIQYPPTVADFKVDKTPPVVNVWTDQSEYTRVQPFTVHFSGYDPEPGSDLFSLTALFDNQTVTDGQVIDLFWLPLGTYTLTATGKDNAGWVTTNSKTITLIATIPSLQQTVNRLCTENYITKQGICTSLSQKLASALSAQQRGQNKTSVNVLLAFQNELKAQKGKAVSVQAYDLLMMDSNFVIRALGGK